MLDSGSVPNLGPSNQSHDTRRAILQEQILMPTQESIESTPVFTFINEAHMHWGIKRQLTISNNNQPSSHVVTTTEVDIEARHSITQQQGFNILVEPQPANNLLPMERFRLCHPSDSATPYDTIQSRSIFSNVATILSEIDVPM